MMKTAGIVLLTFLSQSLADYANFTTVVEMQKIRTPNAYDYKRVTDADLNGPITSISFSVQACNDAHITLQPHWEGEIARNPAYEIVLSGWSNTQSVIRRSFQGSHKDTHRQAVLNCHEERDFWVSWSNGHIKVGFGTDPSDSTMFLDYNDPSPLLVKGVAVSTGWGSTGVWIINKPHKVVSIHTKNEYYYQEIPGVNAVTADYIVFHVKAHNDAHVTLQPISGQTTTATYEIVIGGWGNSQSVIRRSFQETNLDVHSGAVLNAGQYRTFWLSWQNGVISLGTGKYNTPTSRTILRYHDPSPKPVRRVGVSTGWGSTGKWKIENPNI